MRLISLTYSVPLEELSASTRRTADVAFARQVAMYLVHVALGMNLSQVSALFHRDRSTVAHACRLIEDLRDDNEFDDLLELLEKTLKMLHARSLTRPARTRKSLIASCPTLSASTGMKAALS